MEEADALCDRVAIVDDGTIVAMDTPDALKAGRGGDVDRIGTADPAAVERAVREESWVRSVTVTDDAVVVGVDDGEARVAPLVTLASDLAGVTTVSVDRPTLERVFLSLTGRTVEEAETGDSGADAQAATVASDGGDDR